MVPRHEWSCKETEKLHRPRLHVVGAIVAGVLEAYFICEEGMASDSNLQCTILSRLLDLVQNFWAKAGLGCHIMSSSMQTTQIGSTGIPGCWHGSANFFLTRLLAQ